MSLCDSLLAPAPGEPPTPNERALLAEIGAGRKLITAPQRPAAADRSREPARPVGAGDDLSRACSSEFDARTTMSFRVAASVPMIQKVEILALGMSRMALERLSG